MQCLRRQQQHRFAQFLLVLSLILTYQVGFSWYFEALADMLYLLDRNDPYVFVSDLSIERRRMPRGQTSDQLVVRFDLAAYLRSSS